MKSLIILITLFLCFPLNSQYLLNWEFFHPLKKEWIKAEKSGSVQEILISKGELPDPFVGMNENKFDWIENYEWEYRSIFSSDSIDITKNKIELQLPWVDTYAKIYLNDSLILETSNSFLPYFIQIKKRIKKGNNLIKVVFTPPILKHQTTAIEHGIFYPAPNDVGSIQVAPLVRKPQYQFGWDWTMRMNTIGFIQPVSIISYDQLLLKTTHIESFDIDDSVAKMNLNLYFTDTLNQSVILESNYIGLNNYASIKNGKLFFSFDIHNPKLWWPRGQGKQHLYFDTILIKSLEGDLIQKIDVKFGIRKSELIQERDSLGTAYYFKVNEKAIFCKGANLIPMDVFPSKITKEKIKNLVKQMISSNFNIVRVWGGGFYLDDYFYDLCDEYGLMVWQDCMFACAMYPSNDFFIENVRKELNYQIPRISHHPSVIQFNGNNEVDVAWKFWGFQDKYRINELNRNQILNDYNRLFKKVIPEVISSITNIPYIHTSPLGHWINEQDFPHGTQHYWGVWHGKDPIEDFGKKSGRFNAEYGFQSFPEYSTMYVFSNKKDWSLNSQVMKSHQKSYVGNGMIKKHSDRIYGISKNFEEFVYYSQLTQSKAVGIAVSAHRLLSPNCMGTIFWQLNDCWPAPTWSSIDYFGNWKALQYRVKEDFRDVTILEKTEKIGREKYFFVSDISDTFQTNVKYEFYNLGGKKIISENKIFKVYEGIKLPVIKQSILNSYLKSNYLVRFEWKDASGNLIQREFTHIGNKSIYKKAVRSNFIVEIIKLDTVKKTASLKISTSSFLNDFWITNNKGGVYFNQNFFPLLPGVKEIEFQFDTIPSINDFVFKWR